MLHHIVHNYGQMLVGVAVGVVLGGFFPAYAVAAAKAVAATWHHYVVH